MLAFVEAISKGGRGWLVHDTANSQTRDFTSFFSSLALGIIKVSRNGNYRLSYFMTEIVFSGFFHLLKHHCRNLLWRIKSAIYVNPNGIIVTFCHLITPVADLFCHLI